ncbi:MAG: hypothetical protein OXU61_12680 [Gammaproteobacteria bacterium]|nr:hypothetical protein [Gammaproteobacteria bacterium]
MAARRGRAQAGGSLTLAPHGLRRSMWPVWPGMPRTILKSPNTSHPRMALIPALSYSCPMSSP